MGFVIGILLWYFFTKNTFISNVVGDIVAANNSPNTVKSIFIQKKTN